MSKHTVVASTLIGMVAALSCMSAHATFIYLQGAASGTAVVRQAHHEAQTQAVGIADFITTSFASRDVLQAQRHVRRFDWALLPTWLSAPARETHAVRVADSLSPAVDTVAAGGSTAAAAVVNVAPSMPQAPAAGPDVPVSSIDAILADVHLVDGGFIGRDAQAVPDPSPVGLLGVGLLLTFFASSRVRRIRERDSA